VDVQRWSQEPVEELNPSVGRQLIHTDRMTVARLELKKGAYVPTHDHEAEQIVNVLEGCLRFDVEGEQIDVAAGETLVLPSNVPHDATALEDTVVLDVFAPVREDWRRGDDAYLRGDK
jgi:quercetin dioxygenase-like cupin family protein